MPSSVQPQSERWAQTESLQHSARRAGEALTPYSSSGSALVYLGDCRRVMAGLARSSVDAIVTDPPYGIEFMGREWDRGVPGRIFWRHARRVAKPGAHLLAFGGPRTFHRLTCAIEDAGWEIRDAVAWLYGSGFPKSLDAGQGRGTALKPAWEPVVLARKPFRGTVAANVLRQGTGALNIDACRIPTGTRPLIQSDRRLETTTYDKGLGGSKDAGVTDLGRWPANVCLDEEAARALDEEVGPLQSGANPTRRGTDKFRGVYQDFPGHEECQPHRGADSGGPSRFFYTAKASRAEREEGLEDLEARRRSDGREAIDGPGANNPRLRSSARRNDHPTVKPLALMRWLVRLVTPPGGTVLDPFMGSGTTLRAAQDELHPCIGIDIEERHCRIAAKRVRAPLLFGAAEAAEEGQDA